MDMGTCKTIDLKKYFTIVHDENLPNVRFVVKFLKKILQLFMMRTFQMHSGSEGTDSLRKKSRQNLADLYCKINRKSPFKKAAKGCFENCMKSCPK